MRRIGLAVTLAVSVLLAPRADGQDNRAGRVYRVGHLSSMDEPTVNHAAFHAKLGRPSRSFARIDRAAYRSID